MNNVTKETNYEFNMFNYTTVACFTDYLDKKGLRYTVYNLTVYVVGVPGYMADSVKFEAVSLNDIAKIMADKPVYHKETMTETAVKVAKDASKAALSMGRALFGAAKTGARAAVDDYKARR